MSRRARIAGYGTAAVLLVAGVACAVLIGGGTGPLLALSLVGVALVALISLVFMEVGLSEDRERERDRDRRRSRPAGRRPAPVTQLERRRGQRRRLR